MEKVKKNGWTNQPCKIRQMDKNSYVDMSHMDEVKEDVPTLLLHSCCGPCSTAVIERLCNDYRITVYFYNPNITDKEEYDRRKAAQLSFINQYNNQEGVKYKIGFLEGPYDPKRFFEAVSGLEEESEGGRRCVVCFRLRLEQTAEAASIAGYDSFGTTLSVSPHKDFDAISRVGLALGVKYGLTFINDNFKKKDGYKRSVELSREYFLYRQSYCGCSFSKGGK